jgi:hypothetical protein
MPKTIQNHALADCELVIGGETVRGDAEGRFTVPDEWAAKVLGTPGWRASAIGPEKRSKPDPVAAIRERAAAPPQPAPPPPAPEPEPAREDDTPAETPTAKAASEPAAAPEPAADAEAATEPAPADEGGDEEEGPDLEELDKKGLLAVAEKYGIEVTKAQSRGKVADLRAYLDDQLYGEEA